VHFRGFDFLYEIHGVNFSASHGKVMYLKALPKTIILSNFEYLLNAVTLFITHKKSKVQKCTYEVSELQRRYATRDVISYSHSFRGIQK